MDVNLGYVFNGCTFINIGTLYFFSFLNLLFYFICDHDLKNCLNGKIWPSLDDEKNWHILSWVVHFFSRHYMFSKRVREAFFWGGWGKKKKIYIYIYIYLYGQTELLLALLIGNQRLGSCVQSNRQLTRGN